MPACRSAQLPRALAVIGGLGAVVAEYVATHMPFKCHPMISHLLTRGTSARGRADSHVTLLYTACNVFCRHVVVGCM
jgi:hypothetical protein